MIELVPILVAVAVCYLFYLLTYAESSIPRWRTIKMFNKLPGPEAPFFFGSAFELMRLQMPDILSWMKERFDAHGGSFALWMMGNPIYLTADAEVAEVIVSSTKNSPVRNTRASQARFTYDHIEVWSIDESDDCNEESVSLHGVSVIRETG